MSDSHPKPPASPGAGSASPDASAAPEIRVLGPISIDVAGTSSSISSRRARTLLAALVLAYPHPVDPVRLTADVWPDKTPQNPAGALQTQVSRLRRLLGTTIESNAAGYRLAGPQPISDLAAAEAISRPRSGAASGVDPLSWWTGTPGADLPPGRVRDVLAERARVAYQTLREHDWRSRLTYDAAAVVVEIAEIRAELPLDEHLAALHMRACLAADDPNAALMIHAELSNRLGDELGSDPGPEVAAAHSAALSYTPLPHTPAPPTDAYIGTGQISELAAAVALSHVVTVIGPGGIGKSRLVAEFISAQSPPNVFIDLSAARHPDDITAAVSRALARGSVPDQTTSTSLTPRAAGAGIAQLAPNRAIVIFDTCEHLPSAVRDIIDEIRTRRDDLTVIATSRSVLDVADEQIVTLSPLTDAEGAELVTRRARALRRDIRLDPALLAELCTRLDGSPLALELAAAQLRYLSLADVVARVDTRFTLLSVPGTGRHHTLADVVGASWDLLPHSARRTLEVLAQFPGDVRIDDVAHFDDVGTADLALLCDHSLATVIDRPDGHTRYRITETVREFATSQVAADPARERALRRQSRNWATDLVDSLGTQILSGQITDAVARLDESVEAILGILEDAAGVGTTGRGNAVPELAGVGHHPDPAVARLLPIVAWRLVRTGGYPHAKAVSEATVRSASGPEHVLGLACSVVLFTMSGEFRWAARARSTLRRIAAVPVSGPVSLIVSLLTRPPGSVPRTLATAARSTDPLLAAIAEIIRADIAEFAADPVLARRCALRALVAAERCGHPWLTATARQRLGRGHVLTGDRVSGAMHFARSADEFAAIGFTEEATGIRVHQALALAPTDPATATELLDACLRVAADSGRPFVATAYAALAQIRLADDPIGARHHAESAVAIIGPPRDGHSAYLHGVRAVILARTGAAAEAGLAADSLRVALSWLIAMPGANLPALGAAAAAVALVAGEQQNSSLIAAARGARYRRDFTLIELGSGPRASRSALRALLR